MQRYIRHFSFAATAAVVALVLVMPSQSTSPATAQDAQKKSHAEELWAFLQEAQYRHWAPWDGQSGDFYEGQEPHGALLKVYINRKAAGNPESPPVGSIIIKENYTPEKKLAAITIMQRSTGYDPEHNDWYWVKYTPEGAVAEMNGMKLAGKLEGCIQCHGGAGGNDFLFINDK